MWYCARGRPVARREPEYLDSPARIVPHSGGSAWRDSVGWL